MKKTLNKKCLQTNFLCQQCHKKLKKLVFYTATAMGGKGQNPKLIEKIIFKCKSCNKTQEIDRTTIIKKEL
jgi:uncharacterized protein YlaI